MTLPGPETFPANALHALDDAQLRGALSHATGLFGRRRQAAMDDVPDWQALRAHAKALKAETLAHLDELLPAFEARLIQRGATVHWARDAQEARDIVADICRAESAQTVVKSKSMTTEEIHLNAALEELGWRPVETDLGEWIIQLAGETPSHIIVPAIHKTAGQIAELFARVLQVPETTDAHELTATARRLLREEFARADVGISGVNVGIAETGTILVLENEGNARLCTSLPRVHVAVMGIEKLLPSFGDLATLLRLLPRSGTGQHLTSYQSLLTGRVGDDAEGPEELHVILLDNGRSKLLAEEVTRQTLACIRCGACLNACPVYQQVGGHAYGTVYPGPIGSILTPQLDDLIKAAELPFASSLCGACKDACPVGIDIPELLLELRARVVEGPDPARAAPDEALPGAPDATTPRAPSCPPPMPHGSGPAGKLAFAAWAHVMSRPWLLSAASRVARAGQDVGRAIPALGGLARALAPPLQKWCRGREAPALAPRRFRDLWDGPLGRPELDPPRPDESEREP